MKHLPRAPDERVFATVPFPLDPSDPASSRKDVFKIDLAVQTFDSGPIGGPPDFTYRGRGATGSAEPTARFRSTGVVS